MTPMPDSPVSTIMSWPVATIDHDASIEEAAEALAADDLGALLVLRDGDPAGIISERDIVAHVAAGADPAHLHTGEVMSGDLVTIDSASTVLAAARTMLEADVRHLPVLHEHEIAGMISIRDVVPVLVDGIDEDGVVVVPNGARVVVRSS